MRDHMNKRSNLLKKSEGHTAEYNDSLSFFRTAVSRAAYVRAIDLFDGFERILGAEESTFSGLAMTLFGGTYRAVTRVGIPILKLGLEYNKSTWSETVSNALDLGASTLSFVYWILANSSSEYAAHATLIEKYLLLMAVVLHAAKNIDQRCYSPNVKSPRVKKLDRMEKGI